MTPTELERFYLLAGDIARLRAINDLLSEVAGRRRDLADAARAVADTLVRLFEEAGKVTAGEK